MSRVKSKPAKPVDPTAAEVPVAEVPVNVGHEADEIEPAAPVDHAAAVAGAVAALTAAVKAQREATTFHVRAVANARAALRRAEQAARSRTAS